MLFYPLLRKECLQLIRHLAPGKYALSKCADTPVVFFFFFLFLLAVLRGMWDLSCSIRD